MIWMLIRGIAVAASLSRGVITPLERQAFLNTQLTNLSKNPAFGATRGSRHR